MYTDGEQEDQRSMENGKESLSIDLLQFCKPRDHVSSSPPLSSLPSLTQSLVFLIDDRMSMSVHLREIGLPTQTPNYSMHGQGHRSPTASTSILRRNP